MRRGKSRRRKAAHAQAFDAARVGVDDFELKTRFVADQFASDRDPSGKREDETAQGIDVFPFINRDDWAGDLLQRLDGRPGVGVEGAESLVPGNSGSEAAIRDGF